MITSDDNTPLTRDSARQALVKLSPDAWVALVAPGLARPLILSHADAQSRLDAADGSARMLLIALPSDPAAWPQAIEQSLRHHDIEDWLTADDWSRRQVQRQAADRQATDDARRNLSDSLLRAVLGQNPATRPGNP